MKSVLRDGHLEDVRVGFRGDVPSVPFDGLCAKRASSATQLIDAEFGLPDELMPGREVRGDEADEREAVQQVADEVRVVPVNLTKTPLEQSRVPSPRACSVEDLTNVKGSRC